MALTTSEVNYVRLIIATKPPAQQPDYMAQLSGNDTLARSEIAAYKASQISILTAQQTKNSEIIAGLNAENTNLANQITTLQS